VTGSLRVVVAKLVFFTLFTLAVTALLAAVIGNIDPFSDYYDVDADFSDATGLLVSDVVRIAGVDVGKVTGATVTSDGLARVRMQVNKSITLPRGTRAAIRFRNLVGQRMVVLSEGPGPDLPKNGSARIPVTQTEASFDLGIVFNNLRPVLQSLNPEDANIVSRAIVEIFAGREERVQRLVSDLADLSQTLGDRGPVVTKLVDDLDVVLGNLAQRDTELRSILDSFDDLLVSLANRAPELGQAVTDVGSVSNDVADLLQGNRPALDAAIAQLADILRLVAQHRDDLDRTLQALPDTTHGLNRATTYGEWANLFAVCLQGLGECGPSSSSASGVGSIFSLAAARGGTP
jgi:phospholipid/cholesterol/gamma-HCH transport system substrate-binding protein